MAANEQRELFAFYLGYIALWEAVDANPSVTDYRIYLQQYPEGIYAALAKTRLAEAERAAAEEEARRVAAEKEAEARRKAAEQVADDEARRIAAEEETKRQAAAEAATAVPAPPAVEPLTAEELETSSALKRAIIAFYDARRIKRSGNWAGMFRVSKMDEVIDISVQSISGNIAEVGVRYLWSWRDRSTRQGVIDRGVATIEKLGSTYRVNRFTTGGMTYRPGVTGGYDVDAIRITESEIFGNGDLEGMIETYYHNNQVEDGPWFTRRPEIEYVDDIALIEIAGNRARLDVHYRANLGGHQQRSGRAVVTLEKDPTSLYILGMRAWQGP